MKRKNIFLIVGWVLIVFVIVGAWFYWNSLKASDNSLSNVKQRGVLVVGSDIPYGVMEFIDKNNQPTGLDVDVAKEIASRLGVKLEFNDYDWNQLFPKVKNGEVDLAFSSITITTERQQEMLFSDSYFSGGQSIIVSADNQTIVGVNSLFDKKIAVQEGTTGYSEAKKYTSEDLIFSYLNFNSSNGAPGIINDLKNNKFEAIIVDYTQALDIIKSNSGLKIVGVPFTREDYGIATMIGNNSLMNKVNSILRDMKNDGTLEKIETKWTKF